VRQSVHSRYSPPRWVAQCKRCKLCSEIFALNGSKIFAAENSADLRENQKAVIDHGPLSDFKRETNRPEDWLADRHDTGLRLPHRRGCLPILTKRKAGSRIRARLQ